MDCLSTEDKAAITHIWSLFSAAPADQRILILKGLLSTCCMPQLSFLYDEIKPLLRIDFSCILPREVSLRIFSYLDAKSLCHAAQVSRTWKALADDDALWHRMCEQHIDKKCTKCGWGLPLLDKKRAAAATLVRKRAAMAIRPSDSPLRTACGPADILESPPKRSKIQNGASVESFESGSYPAGSTCETRRRSWKEVYSERLVVERNWRRNNYNVRVLQGHTDGVMCVQFCDASNILMTGSYDKTVRIWNLETGEQIRQLTGHTRCVRALQFDSAKLVTGAMDHTLKIWDWHTGRCIRTLEGHTGGVLSLHFNSKLMASGSTDYTIRVWNFQAGECCTLTGHTEWVNCVRLCPQDNLLLSAGDDATVRLWDLRTRSCVQVFRGHVGQVQVALPSPKGFKHRFGQEMTPIMPSNVANSSNNNGNNNNNNNHLTGRFDFQPACATENGDRRPIQQHLSNETCPPSLSENPIIFSAALDNTIKLWDFSGKCLRTLFGHVEGVWSLAFDSLRIVSGSHDRTVRVWDMESGRCMHALEGHSGPVTAVALSDTKIISASDDGDVRIWDYSANKWNHHRLSLATTNIM